MLAQRSAGAERERVSEIDRERVREKGRGESWGASSEARASPEPATFSSVVVVIMSSSSPLLFFPLLVSDIDRESKKRSPREGMCMKEQLLCIVYCRRVWH